VAAIADLEPEVSALSEEAFTGRVDALREAARSAPSLEPFVVPAFALAREAARRTLALRPFDEQIVAALALHEGAVVEMQTGEGKTLAAVLPAFLHALAGQGVHVLTFNDYLARRDAEWMGPVYRRLGVEAAWVQAGLTPAARRAAYASDVTYVTAKEAGFDHLRDLLATDAALLVHRPFRFALVDEADSLLVDEARVPLVIAGAEERAASSAQRLAGVVAELEGDVHFDTDEYGRNVELTEAGVDEVERRLGCGNLYDAANATLLAELHCALHARVLLRRDADYIVRDGRVQLVDEFTGRVVKDRHWPDGLQAALEAKEGLERRPDGRILGSITLQHFLAGYPHLCGMTGTAQDAARELHDVYERPVVVVPTHRPGRRVDQPDVVFARRESKERAVVDEVRRARAAGRPVLVGTLTVEESERLGGRLREAGIEPEVLNALNDAREAAIVARAGALGAVTISTNMAGRGTDIRLGGPDERDRDRVAALGGLYVVGTHRHESRRIDLQLRGRAGRQGDPGESRFFVSLEDDLLVRYGIRRLLPAGVFEAGDDAPLESGVVRREVARAQRIVEGQDLEIRKTLWHYASAVEDQRCLVHARRQALLTGREAPDLWRRECRYATLAEKVGKDALLAAERAATLFHIDRAWSDHLAALADLREGIHLVGLGGDDPLVRFRLQAAEGFRNMQDEVDEAVRAAFDALEVKDGGLEGRPEIKGPSATWTYLINDDPFRDQLGAMLVGPGRSTFAVGAALFATPLLILLGLADKWARRKRRRAG
jgi:preprotein translocase subunit SecA